ncbi:MAG: Holliday junction resolvase RuvX [Myxococcota bacterium]|jgi:putative Holliday junction resolvase
MRILAADLGRKHVGLARCDELGLAAVPHKTLERHSNVSLAEAIAREAVLIGAGKIVIGHPLNMDGSAGPAAKDAEKIAVLVSGAMTRMSEGAGEGVCRVLLWDERLSSWEAENLLREMGAPEAKRRKMIHEASAAVILRSYLESGQGGEV